MHFNYVKSIFFAKLTMCTYKITQIDQEEQQKAYFNHASKHLPMIFGLRNQ